jgi:eukaryotic-like serine/threonine-protein kinase
MWMRKRLVGSRPLRRQDKFPHAFIQLDGSIVSERLPRKLAAILYADVVEYGRLTGEDEDFTHRLLGEYLDLVSSTIESHRGQVMHYAGDAVLAMFDAVVDAVGGAIDIQTQLAAQNEAVPDERRVRFRIGVHLGDVIEDRGDIYGDGVNIAARLETLAEPGGICVSKAVRSAAKNLDLLYEDMGEQHLKNIDEPIRAFAVFSAEWVSAPPDEVVERTGASANETSGPQVPMTVRLNAALKGRYRTERVIGKGGMATVYLADDIKHERKVALKVLKPEFAAVVGAERFLSEIKTTANLQHPHILPLFDSGEADSNVFYVMPYVDGESLRDRLDRECQLSVDEAIRIAAEAAGALHAAHDQGVIHRDIKPENILLSRGRVLIADFGIALAAHTAQGGRFTSAGLSLGTPNYMSPEQATGSQYIDLRSDVFALGCVLYEMLVGEPPYQGANAQTVIGKIITGRPISASKFRPSIPANVEAVVRKALERLPADRFTDAEGFSKALADPGFRHGTMPDGASDVGRWKRRSFAMAVVVGAFAGVAAWSLLRSPTPGPLTKLSVALPSGQEIVNVVSEALLTISSDGSTLVYRGPGSGTGIDTQLWMRNRHELSAIPIPGTELAAMASLSPDGRELAFVTSDTDQLMVMSLPDGMPRSVADSPLLLSLDWGTDDWLYYSNAFRGISRVSAAGGDPEVLTVLRADAGENDHQSARVLPGGKGAVFVIQHTPNVLEQHEIAFVHFESGRITVLTKGTDVRYAATGHLLWTTPGGQLMAASFDPDIPRVGPAVAVLDNVRIDGSGFAQLTLSETGTLVFQTVGANTWDPVWVTRDGVSTEIQPGWQIRDASFFHGASLSPDGSWLTLSQGTRPTQIWVKQLAPDLPARQLTFGGSRNFRPTAMPDGRRVMYVSDASGNGDLWTRQADGDGPAAVIRDVEDVIEEGLVSPNGDWLVYRIGTGGVDGRDIYALPLNGDSTAAAVPILATDALETSPSLSPDGRWLAYGSDESGVFDVWVVSFPEGRDGGQWQISGDGGTQAVWAHNGRELFYRSESGDMIAVEVQLSPTFAVLSRRTLFSWDGYLSSPSHAVFDVSPDDERFLMLRASSGAPGELIWIDNWFEELKDQVPN